MANRLSENEVLGIFEKVSNWGRWGKDDERGALNLITDAKRAAAAKLATTGQVVSMKKEDMGVRQLSRSQNQHCVRATKYHAAIAGSRDIAKLTAGQEEEIKKASGSASNARKRAI